jgi:hypothetical protein
MTKNVYVQVMKDINRETRLSPTARELQIRKFSENVASKLIQ